MATNQNVERFDTFQLLAPAGVNIASGALLIFGRGTHAMACVAQEAQNTTNPPYDSNDGYITVKATGAVNLSVHGNVSSSPSAGGAINRGDPVFADGGTFDLTSGITTGSTLDADSNGTFVGIAQDPVAAGATTTIRVILRNSV